MPAVSHPDPYAPPAAEVVPQEGLEVGEGIRVDDPMPLAWWSIGLLLASDGLALVEQAMRALLPFDGADGLWKLQEIASLVMIWLWLAYLVVFLCWMYRVSWNAKRREPAVVTMSPGWGVGSFFVPIAHLFVPCRMLMQVSRATRGEVRLVLVWWLTAMLVFAIAVVWAVLSVQTAVAEMRESYQNGSEAAVSLAPGSARPGLLEWLMLCVDLVVLWLEVVMVLALSRRQLGWMAA